MSKIITPNQKTAVAPSDLARALLQVKGKPLDMEGFKPFKTVYDVSPPSLVLKSGRQIGKSLSLAGIMVTSSILRPHFGSLFISPLAQQTSRFSSTYLDVFLNQPLIRKHFRDGSSKNNVFEKKLSNGAYIFLGYASEEADADRIRGASVDALYLDEVQDISMEAVPVLRETLSASEFGFMRFTGTSKTENNTLEIKYKQSNGCEWVVKCDKCGKHTIPIDFENCLKIATMNPAGPACVHCGNVLQMKDGRWLAARPDIKDSYGFHINGLILPIRNQPKKWKELQDKISTYSQQKLANEVFGLASGIGGRILSLRECMACCDESRTKFDTGFPTDSRSISCTVIGVDWSVSGSDKSYTVINVLGYDYKGVCYVLYSQRLDGVDILEQVARVEQLYWQFQCSAVGSDRGVGVLQGQMLKQHLGEDKVVMVNYVAAKAAIRWDKAAGYYAADRTMNIDTVVVKAKIGKERIVTPCWELMAKFWQDALNVYEEESMSGRRLYRKDEDLCDDWLHSVVFGNVAYMVLKGEFNTVDETPSVVQGFDLSRYLS